METHLQIRLYSIEMLKDVNAVIVTASYKKPLTPDLPQGIFWSGMVERNRQSKEFAPGRQTSVLYLVFYIVLSAVLFSLNAFPISAGSAEASASSAPESIEGLTTDASGGRLRMTQELPADPPFRRPEGAMEGPPQVGWAATYGGANNDHACFIQQTTDGGYIVAGKTNSFGAGDDDLWVLKLGPYGTVEWQKTYGGDDWDTAYCIRQTSDGGYIAAGVTESLGAWEYDLWVLKLRPDGTIEWQKTYGGVNFEIAESIQQTRDGGYIVAGDTGSFGGLDLWVLKLRPDGTVEWQKTYAGGSGDAANSILETSDGGYIVAGRTRSFGAGRADFWVLKLRPDGTVEWQKAYGGVNEEMAHSIQQTRDGGYIVAGVAETDVLEIDLLVLKLRPDGAVEWQKACGGVYQAGADSIQQTRDGGYIVTGLIPFFSIEGQDLLVLKLGPDGTVEWQKAYGEGNFENGYSIQQTSDGGYIVAGYITFVPLGLGPDLLVMKLRPDGSIHPSCGFVRDTSVPVKDFNATVTITSGIARDSSAHPQDSSATVTVTKVSTRILCP